MKDDKFVQTVYNIRYYVALVTTFRGDILVKGATNLFG